MSTYPNIAIVLVTSHGTIKVTEEPHDVNTLPIYKIPTFKVPSDMSVTLLNAVAPGVCNFWESSDTTDFSNKLMEKLKNKEEIEILKNNPNAFIESLKEILKNYDKTMTNTLENNIKQKDYEDKSDTQRYIYHEDRSYYTNTYGPNNLLINKYYSRNNQTERSDSRWNFKVLVINKSRQPDIIQEIHGRNYDDINVYISFEDIINYLKQDNVKNVIFLDLSCSNFVIKPLLNKNMLGTIDDSDDDEYDAEDDRQIRHLRQLTMDILNANKKGGRRKRLTKRRKRLTKRRKRLTKRRKYKIKFK